MRTTVTLDDDVAAAVDRLRRETGSGPSEIINELMRAGLTASGPRQPFKQRSQPVGARIDLTNIGEVLEFLEGPDDR